MGRGALWLLHSAVWKGSSPQEVVWAWGRGLWRRVLSPSRTCSAFPQGRAVPGRAVMQGPPLSRSAPRLVNSTFFLVIYRPVCMRSPNPRVSCSQISECEAWKLSLHKQCLELAENTEIIT